MPTVTKHTHTTTRTTYYLEMEIVEKLVANHLKHPFNELEFDWSGCESGRDDLGVVHTSTSDSFD